MNRTESSVDDLEQPLRDVLSHFYDPSYEAPRELLTLLGLQAQQPSDALWNLMLQTIESLKPSPEIPATSHVWRLYNILVCRYTKNMTQEETAEHLGISPRHLRREQQLAVRVLARKLLEEPSAKNVQARDTSQVPNSITESSQIAQELAALQKTSPGAVSDVKAVILKAAEHTRVLRDKHAIGVSIEGVQAFTVTLHPSVFQQIVVELIERFCEQGITKEVVFQTEQESHHVLITATADVAKAEPIQFRDFIEEMLRAEGGSVTSYQKKQKATVELRLPVAKKQTVLVVDDNLDLVHFYKRYTTNTKYQIHHVSEGYDLIETVLRLSPNIILLDVMLPDTDGWELLTRLREHPETRSIPVIVCSVIKDEELASTLGASTFLAKPVNRQQFLEALEHVSRGAP